MYTYKGRDKAEKFIRDLKEGIELGPIRHWTTEAIIGIVFLSFLAKSIESLTLISAKISIDSNVKLLKKIPDKFDSDHCETHKRLQIHCCEQHLCSDTCNFWRFSGQI